MPIYLHPGTRIKLKRDGNWATVIRQADSISPLPRYLIIDDAGKVGVVDYGDIDFNSIDWDIYTKVCKALGIARREQQFKEIKTIKDPTLEDFPGQYQFYLYCNKIAWDALFPRIDLFDAYMGTSDAVEHNTYWYHPHRIAFYLEGLAAWKDMNFETVKDFKKEFSKLKRKYPSKEKNHPMHQERLDRKMEAITRPKRERKKDEDRI